MSSEDPYRTPQAEPAAIFAGDPLFEAMDHRSVKKLYYRSCNVNAITLLLALAVVLLLSAVAMVLGEAGHEIFFLGFGLAAFYGVSAVGLFHRTKWGRVLGIIVCILSLISFPIGTLIGAFGLAAFFGAPQLFGKGRVTHKVLRAEFKRRRAAERGR